MGSTGPGPEARDGVVDYALAQELIGHTCHVLQVKHAAIGHLVSMHGVLFDI